MRKEIKNTADKYKHRQCVLWVRLSLHQFKMQGKRAEVGPSLCRRLTIAELIQPVLLTVAKFPSSTGIQYYYICLLLRDDKKYGKDLLRIMEQLTISQFTPGLEKPSPLTNVFACKNTVMHLRGAEVAAQVRSYYDSKSSHRSLQGSACWWDYWSFINGCPT